MRLKATGERKVFSGIASCSRISSSSIRAMKRKPSAAPIRIRPTSLWSALVAISTQRARRLGKPSMTSSGRALMASSPASIRPTTRSWAAWMSAFWLLTKASYSSGRDDFDLGPHRRVGLAGEGRRLAVEGAFLVGAEDDLVVLARAPRRACPPGPARPRCGRRRWRRGRGRRWCRPGRRACNRRRLRSGSRSATATAGRSLRSAAARSGRPGARRRRWRASRAPCR